MIILRYRRPDGVEPITDWLLVLRDKRAIARIRLRLLRLQDGNFGDSKSVGEGVCELRIPVGAGYRVYFGRQGKTVVDLLCGGDKDTQAADIRRAKDFWADWNQRSK